MIFKRRRRKNTYIAWTGDPHLVLFKKAKSEYLTYLDMLKKNRKCSVFDHAYETAAKKFILNIFRKNLHEHFLDEYVVEALVKIDHPLSAIYHAWTSCDRGIEAEMCECISSFGRGLAFIEEDAL